MLTGFCYLAALVFICMAIAYGILHPTDEV